METTMSKQDVFFNAVIEVVSEVFTNSDVSFSDLMDFVSTFLINVDDDVDCLGHLGNFLLLMKEVMTLAGYTSDRAKMAILAALFIAGEKSYE